MSAPIELEAAWERLLAVAQPLENEEVEVDHCAGRFLADRLLARRTQPEADLSAMDGYAIRGVGPWEHIGESRAGRPFHGALEPNQAVTISTGAHCPPGTDAVLIAEHSQLNEAVLTADSAPQPGAHIRRPGFDFAAGSTVIEAGAAIGPAQLALARAAGHASLVVARRPRIAVMECGDELVVDPTNCPSGSIPASNGAMVGAMASAAGAQVDRIGPVADDRMAMRAAFEQAASADLIVTIGGASVGPHDLVRSTLEEIGASVDFWKVAIRPGKPVLLARRAQGLALGLPGNPVSSFVTAFLFMVPLIRALQGAARPFPRSILQPLAVELRGVGERREFLRARFAGGSVIPLAERDSSAMVGLAQAELLIDRAAGASPMSAGALVPCYLLETGCIA